MVHECPLGGATFDAHISVQPLSGVCSAVCDTALSPPENERGAPV